MASLIPALPEPAKVFASDVRDARGSLPHLPRTSTRRSFRGPLASSFGRVEAYEIARVLSDLAGLNRYRHGAPERPWYRVLYTICVTGS